MTPHQVLIVAAIGGVLGVVGAAAFVLTAFALVTGISNLIEQAAARRARRRARREDLTTCRAIEALGTTSHPTDK
ncbi:hypothetical protein ACH41H_36280 [Streptomyces sp. NPDC020800]|uniref:hypothetical protein n=1 Tax=Streptomyces sp. NPDC020800 TaxID=3365092 RepID=UPI0037938D29